MADPATASEGLFARLKAHCAADWRAYTEHAFVAGMADGTLPKASFQHYLVQDYLFLIQFARAYGLAVYKAETLADMRAAAATLQGILQEEMRLHVDYCRAWGLDEAALTAAPEANATLAYTRFVLERGMAGDLLDLHVALAPCVVGYGEIGARLAADAATRAEGNPYRSWIEMYASTDYQRIAGEARALIDRLGAERGAGPRFAGLCATFAKATRLEADFWQMGLDRAS